MRWNEAKFRVLTTLQPSRVHWLSGPAIVALTGVGYSSLKKWTDWKYVSRRRIKNQRWEQARYYYRLAPKGRKFLRTFERRGGAMRNDYHYEFLRYQRQYLGLYERLTDNPWELSMRVWEEHKAWQNLVRNVDLR